MVEALKITGECPHCGGEVEVERFEMINAEEQPEVKAALLRGDYFDEVCPHCQKPFMAATPLLYYEPRYSYLLQFVPGYDGNEELLLDDIFDALAMADGQPSQMIKRIVRDPNELLEKIYLLEAGLEDRLVEIGKAISVQAHMQELPDPKQLRQVLYTPGKPEEEASLVFLYEGLDEVPTMDFPRALYDQVGAAFYDALNEEKPTAQVDLAWAVDFLHRQNQTEEA